VELNRESASPGLSWPDLLSLLLRGQSLDAAATRWAMDQVMSGEASPVQVAGFVIALRAKGETAEEMDGLVSAMLDHAHRIDVPGPIVDIVGTGGDRAQTVNISTMAAIVVAGTGATVVKHGNRAASSACGSADLLEELGVVLTLTPDQVQHVALAAGITFCFAQVFHPAFRHAAAPRRELGVPTAFNFLGPLTNPAQPQFQAVGVADLRMAAVMAEVFARRGVAALVFRGDDGLDELTVSTTSTAWEVRDGEVAATTIDPSDLGLDYHPIEALRGGDRSANAAVTRAVLAGEVGPVRDAVLLNAAAALAVMSTPGSESRPMQATLVDRLRAGMQSAAESIDTGAAAKTLDRWVAATQSQASAP
jgi:anthranilate phosphoribosyltransferase